MHKFRSLAFATIFALTSAACGSSSSGDGSDAGDSVDALPGAADATATGPLAGWCQGQPTTFSFFVTSMNALWAIAGTPISDLNGGLGGDFGGISGADEICQSIGAATGNGHKTWRAFLSATDDGAGNQVDAIDRIGAGPWNDANGRVVATGIAGLLADDRPDGDAQSVSDLPDECGVPISTLGDAHDVITGSNTEGRLNETTLNSTCNDWTSSDGNIGGGSLRCGHSFPRATGGGPGGDRGQHWLSDHPVPGCGKGATLVQGPSTSNCIGCSGGYGAIYCFAL